MISTTLDSLWKLVKILLPICPEEVSSLQFVKNRVSVLNNYSYCNLAHNADIEKPFSLSRRSLQYLYILLTRNLFSVSKNTDRPYGEKTITKELLIKIFTNEIILSGAYDLKLTERIDFKPIEQKNISFYKEVEKIFQSILEKPFKNLCLQIQPESFEEYRRKYISTKTFRIKTQLLPCTLSIEKSKLNVLSPYVKYPTLYFKQKYSRQNNVISIPCENSTKQFTYDLPEEYILTVCDISEYLDTSVSIFVERYAEFPVFIAVFKGGSGTYVYIPHRIPYAPRKFYRKGTFK